MAETIAKGVRRVMDERGLWADEIEVVYPNHAVNYLGYAPRNGNHSAALSDVDVIAKYVSGDVSYQLGDFASD